MLTEAMRRAGWRECPSDEVRRAWEEKGGRWHISWLGDGSDNIGPGSPVAWPPFHNVEDSRIGQFSMWRPVNPQTWNVDWRGWGVVVPTDPGLWWRDDYNFPVQVVTSLMFDGTMIFMQIDEAGEWMDVGAVEDDGHWIAPCIKPEVLNG